VTVLRRVRAGLVEGIDSGEVALDCLIGQRAEMHARHFVKTLRAAARVVAKENCGANVVGATAQAPKNSGGIEEIHGLADDDALERDERIGAQHDGPG